jgi:hypothetical protein
MTTPAPCFIDLACNLLGPLIVTVIEVMPTRSPSRTVSKGKSRTFSSQISTGISFGTSDARRINV